MSGRRNAISTLAGAATLCFGLVAPQVRGDNAPAPTPAPSPRPAKRRPPLRERLLLPLGGTRQASAAADAVQIAPLLRFREEITVEAPPLDLQRLRAIWAKQWDLPHKPGTGFGTPTHADLLARSKELSRLSGMPLPQEAPLLQLAIAAGTAIAKKLRREEMPPADPGPPYVEPFVPLEPPADTTPAAAPRTDNGGEPSGQAQNATGHGPPAEPPPNAPSDRAPTATPAVPAPAQ